jgi:outer membrane receptor for ferrienterochelin and colicins
MAAASLLPPGRAYAQAVRDAQIGETQSPLRESDEFHPSEHGVDATADAEAPLPDADNLDSLLDAADKDIGSLASVNVASQTIGTDANPVVEGVSKKAETLAESPGIVDVITARDIEQFGAKNLYEVLQRATSVFMTGSFLFPRNVASIRGNLQNHEDNHVLVLINGRPFRDVTAGGVNVSIYTAFPIHTIDHIEVIRGPGSVLYGTNAFNGVINIVTKDPDKPTLYASTLNGSHGWQSYSAAAGSGNEAEAGYAGATYSRQLGWPFSATEDVVAQPPLDTDTARWGEDNFGAFAMYRNGNLAANVFAARATEEQLGPAGDWPSRRLDDPRVFCDFGYLLELDDWQSIQTNFTYNFDGVNFPASVPGLPFNTRSNSYLIESTYRVDLTDDLGFMLGGLVDFHEGIASIPPLLDPIPEYREIWYGVYMQMEYQALEWLKLVGGMQANLPGDIKSGIVPRFGAIATLSERWTGKFLYGQAFRSPYQIERSIFVPGILVGNPGLIPETIQTFDLQLAYRTEDFRLAATYFHSDYFDIITRSSTIPQLYSNGGRMAFDGVELENDWELNDNWRCMGSMTYQTNLRDGVRDTTSAPNWMAKMGLNYHTDDGWNVGMFDTFFGDQTVPASAVPLNADPQAYHLVSLNTTLDLDRRLGWSTGHSMQLQFLIQNLFDERIDHVEFERELINSFPAGPGRTYYGGVSVQY